MKKEPLRGLQATVTATELETLARARATHHLKRYELWTAQAAEAKRLQDEAEEGTASKYSNITEDAAGKAKYHKSMADWLNFLADHLEKDGEYRLSSSDVASLGIGHNS